MGGKNINKRLKKTIVNRKKKSIEKKNQDKNVDKQGDRRNSL